MWLLALLAAYVVVMMALGAYGRRRTHGVLDYYVGGRSLGGVVLGLSFFATYASTNSYLGFSSQSYSYGVAWLLLVPAAVLFSLTAWYFVAPRLRTMTEQLDSITLPDFIGFRFRSPSARSAAALVVLFASLLYMVAVYKGIGNLLETLLDVSYPVAVGFVLLTVVAYTSVGGFHSVVRTDAVQAMFMLVAALLLFTRVTEAAGGLSAYRSLADAVDTEHLLRLEGTLPLGVLVGIVIASTVKFLVEPRQLSRFYALADPAEARKGIWVSTGIFLVVFGLLTPIGLYGRLLVDGLTDTDLLVPNLMIQPELFGPFARSLLMLALVSAAMSSLDSVLLVLASTVQRDLIEVASKKIGVARWGDHTRMTATRVWVVILAVATAVLALDPPGGICAVDLVLRRALRRLFPAAGVDGTLLASRQWSVSPDLDRHRRSGSGPVAEDPDGRPAARSVPRYRAVVRRLRRSCSGTRAGWRSQLMTRLDDREAGTQVSSAIAFCCPGRSRHRSA